MNLMHLKYVVELNKTRSFSKAAENLYMGQPNLSRAIKDLEKELNIKIFNRTTKGIEVTPEGEEFIQNAKKILYEFDKIERRYSGNTENAQRFSIVVPRATYISKSLIEFLKELDKKYPMNIVYKETNSLKSINKVIEGEYRLGIVRYRKTYSNQFKKLFEEKGLTYEVISEFKYLMVANKNSALAKLSFVKSDDLINYIEICHPDPYVPTLPMTDLKKLEFSDNVNKRIYVFERASQFEMLENVDNTFMWVSPIPHELLEKYNLTYINYVELSNNEFNDVLIYKKGYHLTDIDKNYLTILCNEARKFKRK